MGAVFLMDIELLQAIIAAWPAPEAARVCQGDKVIAQNALALAAAAAKHESANNCEGEFWSSKDVIQLDLPNELQLQTRAVHGVSHSPQVLAAHLAAPQRTIEVQALARGVVHELRNPLAAIVTAAGLLQDDDETSDETQMLLGVITKESRRMNRILTEFAAYVKPRPPQRTDFDAAQVLREETRAVLKARTLNPVEIEIDDKLPPQVRAHADEEQFRQVIGHVIHNALEAMSEGGTIKLMGEVHTDKVHLCIGDDGPGLSGEAMELAFQPFFSSKSQSTGLGLSIARSAIEASGGRIWIENEGESESCRELEGARIVIELPRALNKTQ